MHSKWNALESPRNHCPCPACPYCCLVAQSCPTLCDPMNCSTPGLPVLHHLQELAQTHIHWVSDAIQASHPLSSPSPSAFYLSQHQSLFQWVSSLHLMCVWIYITGYFFWSRISGGKGLNIKTTTTTKNKLLMLITNCFQKSCINLYLHL